ncbi:hypothetical protein L2E82_17138 [Cichorium intybus]|uniref:Uncharacterized protein n=1 Tax=Cichorium intybus TaxID=13427 RepID=A0ACB9F7G3_CICIN|nr:hypothetical protein L2E82_17138 [Cichorium intybus]
MGFESQQKLFGSIPTSALSYFWGTPALTPAGVALYKDDNHQKDQRTMNYNWVEGLNVPLTQPPHLQLDGFPLIRDWRKASGMNEKANHATVAFIQCKLLLDLVNARELDKQVEVSLGGINYSTNVMKNLLLSITNIYESVKNMASEVLRARS